MHADLLLLVRLRRGGAAVAVGRVAGILRIISVADRIHLEFLTMS